MKNREDLTRFKSLRLRQSEFRIIETMSVKLDLNESEVIRQAIRIGLPILNRRHLRAEELALALPSE